MRNNKKLFNIIIFIFIIFIISYLIISGGFKTQSLTSKNTRDIYNILTKEITIAGGSYKQFGGQIIRGFILDVNVDNLNNNKLSKFLDKIEQLGFQIRDNTSEEYLLCKEKEGVYLIRYPFLKIIYDNEMTKCF